MIRISRSPGRRHRAPLAALAVASAAALAAWTLPAAAQAPGPAAAAPKVAQCITCHGEQGISRMPDVPNLAGQPEIYLREQLKAYRSGKRQHEIMGVIARSLSDADIADVAGWFSGIEIQAKPRN